jgi:hypothetical protein
LVIAVTDRVSRGQRLQAQNVAEREVMRYAGDHALWHKHVHNVELDPMQVLKCIEMDQHRNTIDFSCRRTGKTAIKELYLLEHNATNADQELGIVAPREAQAIVNLGYHLEAIRRSPILMAWLNYKSQRVQLADTYYQFANRSVAKSYGIMAQVDGGDLTSASLEEVDDMPRDRLFSRFLLMMGATRRLGASKEAKNDPQIRITGVFKGADTLTDLINSGQYHVVPTVDVHLGIELGILNAEFMAQMRAQLDASEYIRQLLCLNRSSRNLIWEVYVRKAMQLGVKAGLSIAQPMPGERYKKRGLLGFGYDAGGHGERPDASKHSLVVAEQLGNHVAFPFVKQWPAGADDQVVKQDLKAFWRYFRPDYAAGDAYGVGMLTALNDELFHEGLVDVDRRSVGDGSSTQSTWPYWPFAPMRFEGMTKHQMAKTLKGIFHHERAVVPYFDDRDMLDSSCADMRAFTRQLPNIRELPTSKSYSSFRMADEKIGDDTFDAACAAVWSLFTQGTANVPTVILTSNRERQDFLPSPA